MNRPALVAIPEDRVAAILARAAELDRERRETFTMDAIRTAAVDAGISLSAVDEALAEYAAGRVAPVAPPPQAREPKPRLRGVRAFFSRTGRALRTPVRLGALMFIFGLAGAAGEGAIAIGMATGVFLALRLIRRQRPLRRARPFLASLVFMTVGLALGFAVGEVDEDAIAATFAVAVPLLVLGTAVIKLRLPKRAGSRGEEFRAGVA